MASFEHDDRQVGDTKILSQRDFGTVLLWRLLLLCILPRVFWGFSSYLDRLFSRLDPASDSFLPFFHILLPSVYCGLQGITTVLHDVLSI